MNETTDTGDVCTNDLGVCHVQLAFEISGTHRWEYVHGILELDQCGGRTPAVRPVMTADDLRLRCPRCEALSGCSMDWDGCAKFSAPNNNPNHPNRRAS